MYIEPNTNIKILHNVPLENTYDHSLYFASATAQYNYFASMVYKNCVNYTYQRVNKGVMRIDGKADLYYNCNYLMFQNTNFGNKWFYAFITSVEYINNETTEITFEIDVIQTWLFDAHIEECFIERQHSLSDGIGDNIIPENLNMGEYVFNNYEPVMNTTGHKLDNMCVIIAITDTTQATSGQLYDGIYGGAKLLAYNSTDVSAINSKINEYLQKPDAITAMYMCPKEIIGTIPTSHILPYGASGFRQIIQKTAVAKTMSLDGYTPKNGKMYTYPYNFYHVDNASGQELNLRYEFFDDLTPMVEIDGTITQPVQVTLRPVNYKGMPHYTPPSGGGIQNPPTTLNTEVIQLNNYPMCSWNVDAYQAWVAQNAIPIGYGVINTLATGGIASNYSAHPAGTMGAGIVGSVTSVLSDWYKASIQADISKGSFNNGGVNTAIGKQQFYGGRCSVNYQTAKMIDDYFTMFGYAVKAIGRPYLHARPHWTYIKTLGCTLSGSIPSDDAKKIISVYDNGITFWMNANEVGNYSLDNSLNES